MKLFALKEKGIRREYVEFKGTVYKSPIKNTEFLTKIYEGNMPDLLNPVNINLESVMNGDLKNFSLDFPIEVKEIWGSGITYYISRQRYSEDDVARIRGKTIYEKVYESERPEIFFKATLQRCSPPNGNIAIRSDSTWTLPEPELAVVLDHNGNVLAYTIMDDVSARDIEAENPLYLPESKIYNGCCSYGPIVVTPDEISDLYDIDIKMTIHRGGRILFEGNTNTKNMKTKIETQISYLLRDNDIPDLTILTTGTSIIPGKNQGLQDGDSVEITIDKIGTLKTGVIGLYSLDKIKESPNY
jgi:2-dehydro-3-deoxy-D-arabinonate dehydratase